MDALRRSARPGATGKRLTERGGAVHDSHPESDKPEAVLKEDGAQHRAEHHELPDASRSCQGVRSLEAEAKEARHGNVDDHSACCTAHPP